MNVEAFQQAVDITAWRRDEEFAHYPEGARDKTLVYSPDKAPFSFLLLGHRYLFKRSSPRYPEHFWMEIIAYHLGLQMGVPVPKTFAGYDTKEGQSGALIEWFFFPQRGTETYIAGGDFCQQYIPNFDRKKGKQHNFETVAQIFADLKQKHPLFHADWKAYWAKAFVFDALIGNTDRHQDNWGIIEKFVSTEERTHQEITISPVFDNGTSLGYNILAPKFSDFEKECSLEKHFSRGWHHMKWEVSDQTQMNHCDFLKKFSEKYPETMMIMLTSLKKVNFPALKHILESLTHLKLPVKLSSDRASFVLRLLQFRHKRLLLELDK